MALSNLLNPNNISIYSGSNKFNSITPPIGSADLITINISTLNPISKYSKFFGSTITNSSINGGINTVCIINFSPGTPNQSITLAFYSTSYTRSSITPGFIGQSTTQLQYYHLNWNSGILTQVVPINANITNVTPFTPGTIGQVALSAGSTCILRLQDINQDITSWTYTLELYSKI